MKRNTAKSPFNNKSRNLVTAVFIIAVIAGIGYHILVSSHAESPYGNIYAANGTLKSPAVLVPGGSNSSGDAVKFTAALATPSPSPSASPSPTPTGSTDPSGQPVPIGDQPGWHQVFYDDFTDETVPLGDFSNCETTTVPVCTGLPKTCTDTGGACPSLPTTGPQEKWWDYPDGWQDTQKDCDYYPSQTMSIANNIMNMYIHTASNGTCMTAVPEPILPPRASGSVGGATGSEGGQLYGMYSVRFKSDPIPGYKTAFLLWPDDENWPADGEIDFPEGELDGTIGAFMHWEGATSGSQQDAYGSSDTYTSWHTATLEWAPTYVKFILDGVTIGDSTSHIPDTPMHWVLQTESDIGASSPPAASASGNLQIAWVAMWSYDPSAE
jgi:hypothetical protein